MSIKLFYTDDPIEYTKDFSDKEIREQTALSLNLLAEAAPFVSQDEINHYINSELEAMYDEFADNIDLYMKKYRVAGFLIKGVAEHWNGHSAGFELADDASDIINSIMVNTNTIYQDSENPLQLLGKGTHHDGTDYYEIMTIAQRGIEYVKLHGEYYGDETASEMYFYLEKNKLIKSFFAGNRKIWIKKDQMFFNRRFKNE